MNWGEAYKNIKDYVFPIFCLNCDKEGSWLCTNCIKKLNTRGGFSCPICSGVNPLTITCKDCLEQSFLCSVVSIFEYKEGEVISKLIYNLKYQYAEEVLSTLKILVDNFIDINLKVFDNVDMVTFVPLHKKRKAERGFNQAEKIAEIISTKIDKPLLEILFRSRNTPRQARLDRKERLKNVSDAFVVKDNVVIDNKNILLVDDVFTTGTTMQECARVIKSKNSNLVHGFTLARGK